MAEINKHFHILFLYHGCVSIWISAMDLYIFIQHNLHSSTFFFFLQCYLIYYPAINKNVNWLNLFSTIVYFICFSYIFFFTKAIIMNWSTSAVHIMWLVSILLILITLDFCSFQNVSPPFNQQWSPFINGLFIIIHFVSMTVIVIHH